MCSIIYKNITFKGGPIIQENVIVGAPSREYLQKREEEWPETVIGNKAILRSGTIIYCGVIIGGNFTSGHNVLIRERTVIGDDVLIGTNTIIDGQTRIGNRVIIQSAVYIPLCTTIEDNVFIGPNAVFTNDKYPGKKGIQLKGPILRKGATIGANCTILLGIEVGEGAMVTAGSVVTKNVPARKLAIGVPTVIKELPGGF
ncbi:MAG TPA: N-acetyltransferase [Candidatus Omnitrophica bacterium]|nr:N-acetyltransferase [Candidatus Omnitrophota bacterium]